MECAGGTTTVLEELRDMLAQHKPDVLILTETKLTSQSQHQRVLRDFFADQYVLHYSSVDPPKKLNSQKEKIREGSAGVLVAVNKIWTGAAAIKRLTLANLSLPQGHAVGLQIQPPNSDAMTVWGVYMPFEPANRKAIYSHLSASLANAQFAIVGGDWNATLFPTDRENTSKCPDKDHSKFVQALNLCALDAPLSDLPGGRPKSHHPNQENSHPSRIDDILVTRDLAHSESSLEVVTTSGSSDHDLLHGQINITGKTFLPPPTEQIPVRKPRLKTSNTNAKFAHFKETLTVKTATQVEEMHREITHLVAQAKTILSGPPSPLTSKQRLEKGGMTAARVQEIGNKIKTIIAVDVMEVARETLEYTKPSMGPPKAYWPRKLSRAMKASTAVSVYLRKAMKCYDNLLEGGELQSQNLDHLNNELAALHMPATDTAPELDGESNTTVWVHIETSDKAHATRIQWKKMQGAEIEVRKELHIKFRRKRGQNHRKSFQTLFATKQKTANKIIKGSSASQQITALRNHEGEIVTDANKLPGVTHKHFQDQANPIQGRGKNGKFLPQDVKRGYPWERGVDNFTLESRTKDPNYKAISILDLMSQKSTFLKKVRCLSKGKAPGKDDVPNEVLKNLPDRLLDAIHSLFILMYMTGTTPDDWKVSHTVLLHTKNCPLDLKNYRPIALADTLAKLWTGMLAECISTYAKSFDILSSSQEEFRRQHNTIRQIQSVQMVLTDAMLLEQNIYYLFVDFSSAFNTIDHDRLLVVMHDLGFPTDCIDVIKDLYDRAETRFVLPAGLSPTVEINRGTLQGDSLSPLLFLIFMEPLLRWLHAGGRGYYPKCLRKDHPDFKISAHGYADDLGVPTSNLEDLKIQASKIE